MPTITELIGIKPAVGIDGLSFAPTLLGEKEQAIHDYLYWEFHELGGRRAIRKDNWKLVQYNVGVEENTTYELFDLDIDPSESNNVASSNSELFEELKEILFNARTRSEVFQFADEQFKG
jgi:arylsulfatase A-like enzyme